MKEYETIIGIDGGKLGAIAINKNNRLKVVKMPADTNRIKLLFQNYDPENSIVFIEKVSAFVGEDNSKRFGIIKMLEQVKGLKTVLEFMGFTVIDIASISWQSRLGFRSRTKGMEKKDRKEIYFQWAKEWAPYTLIKKYQGDAVCILACGMKMIRENDPLISGSGKDVDLF